MKIAVSSSGDSLESKVDMRFGRCKNYVVVDVEDEEIKNHKVVKNEAAQQAHGAGIKAGELLGEEKVEKVITGNIGPNASNVLKQLDIKVYQASDMTVKEAVEKLIKGELKDVEATVGGHFGAGRE